MIVASDINQWGISTSDTAHIAHNNLLRKLNDFQSAICLISGRLPPDSLLKNLIRNQTCDVVLVLQKERLWGFSLCFQNLVLFHESTLISHSYPYFLGAANEHFSCRKQFILPPLGARSKPSSGPSGAFLLFWLNYGKLSVPAALSISSCVTETISWQLFLDDLEPSHVFGGSSCVSALFPTSLSLAVCSKHDGTTPDAECCTIAAWPSSPAIWRCTSTFPDLQIV